MHVTKHTPLCTWDRGTAAFSVCLEAYKHCILMVKPVLDYFINSAGTQGIAVRCGVFVAWVIGCGYVCVSLAAGAPVVLKPLALGTVAVRCEPSRSSTWESSNNYVSYSSLYCVHTEHQQSLFFILLLTLGGKTVIASNINIICITTQEVLAAWVECSLLTCR